MKKSILKSVCLSVLPLVLIACEDVEYIPPQGDLTSTRFEAQPTKLTDEKAPIDRPSTELEAALSNREGIHGKIMVEDLFPNKRGGVKHDYDFDDIIIEFRIQPVRDQFGNLAKLVLDFAPHPHSASFSTKVDLDVSTQTKQLIRGEGAIKVEKYDVEGSVIAGQGSANKDLADIATVNIFEDTLLASNHVTKVDELGDDPLISTRITITPFSSDITLDEVMDGILNRIAIRFTVTRNFATNPDEVSFYMSTYKNPVLDKKGYPSTLLVPLNWRPMASGVSIDEAYPEFMQFRMWLANELFDKDSTVSRLSRWFNSGGSATSSKLGDKTVDPVEQKIPDDIVIDLK